MTDLRPLRPKQVDVTKLKYSPVKSLENGSKTVYIYYGPDRLTIQTPMLHIPYAVDNGAYDAKDPKKGKGKPEDPNAPKRYDLNISFRGKEDNPELNEFYEKIEEIEKRIVDDAFANRLAWLRDDYDGIKSVVAKLMSPMIKHDRDRDTGKVVGRYPPTLKLKLPYDNAKDDFNFESVDMDRNVINLKENLSKLKGAKGRFLIQLSGIWIAGGKYGATWKVISAKFQLTSKSRYSFLDDDEDASGSKAEGGAAAFSEDEDLDEDAVMATGKAAPAAPALVDDSEEDEEEEHEEDEEEEEAPPPPPAPKGKKVVAPPPPPPVEDEEDEEEDDSEFEEPPPPPPKKVPAAARKAPAKK